jgi:hypothetical protein
MPATTFGWATIAATLTQGSTFRSTPQILTSGNSGFSLSPGFDAKLFFKDLTLIFLVLKSIFGEVGCT